ncbi:LacI family DNA-binding transcriptional regulator [Catenovulum maritimum]|uniref:Transcriptional regulator n=1 Tax=Catenovulum maritimum TaxID=1513271 RepID=A0A0J8JQ70_9ALTE|nr:LacI family DNA-binding transcriptional regulator [Catenovulum maritimum]KMT66871.1 transcriptional regulator [Catenovulum maritimum]
MFNIKDVAKLAGVSPATVSRVLNDAAKVSDKTRKKVEDAVQQLGFVPNANARALVKKSTKTIGVVLSELADPFFAMMAHSIELAASRKGIKVLISTGSSEAEKERQAINNLRSERCDAMIVNSKALDDESLITLANSISGFVLINKFIPAIKSHCIGFDNFKGGQLMAEYIASLGHQDIAVITSDNRAHDANLRISGIKHEMSNQGLSLADNAIICAQNDYAGGRAALAHLLDNKIRFTALLCFNDQMALGAIAQLKACGLNVPDDVSVIGFDDLIYAQYCSPKLTTIKYPIDIMAEKATEMALALSQKKETNSQGYQYQPSLIRRASTRPVNPNNNS